MSTKEIPREKWTEFFDGFSRRHEGWLVNVQVLGDLGAQTEVRELPLTGISAGRDARKTSSIFAGDSPDVNVERLIQRPSRVFVEEEEGAERALEVEDE